MNFAKPNFSKFTSTLKAKATEAANAAREFKGFDDMAAKDDYIHSEGLNLGKRAPKKKQPTTNDDNNDSTQQQPKLHPSLQQLQNNNNDVETASTTSWSLLDRPPLHHSDSAVSQSTTTSVASTATGGGGMGIELSTVVNSAASTTTNDKEEKKTTTTTTTPSVLTSSFLSRMNSPLSNSATSSVTTMPLLSVVADALSDTGSEIGAKSDNAEDDDYDENKQQQQKKKKNPNRFMEDIRMTIQEKVMGAKKKDKTTEEATNNKSDGVNDFEVTSSTNMLGSDEMAQLQALQRQSTPFDAMAILDLMKSNPRETFVLLTLIFASLFFFYSKKTIATESSLPR